MRATTRIVFILLGMATAFLSGCAGIGPGTVTRDRFDYTSAISESWKTQMLLNIVKTRYGDAPVFLDVASVINQYAFEAQGNVGAVWESPLRSNFPVPWGNSLALGGTGRYRDQPTITYNPITGEKFTRNLMTPIPPASVLTLVQAGYPIDLVFRALVQAVNGIDNRRSGVAKTHGADPEFYSLLERLKRIQEAGEIALRIQQVEGKAATLIVFVGKPDKAIQADREEVRKTLSLDPHAREFRVVYGSVAANDKEIAILTRSFLEIMIDQASYVEVPEAHVAEKRVTPTLTDEAVRGPVAGPLIRISSSKEKPTDAFVSVPYRGHWFWIDDRDFRSKGIFSFLMFVFSLTETGGKEGAPILTVPIG